MNTLRNRFLSAVGDKETIGILLEGAVLPIAGPKALIFLEEDEWLYDERHRFTALCNRIRSQGPLGCQVCLESDKHLCRLTESKRTATLGMCAAGLFDIAMPVIVKDICVAAILCGQIRPQEPHDRQLALEKLHLLAQRLAIPERELLQLWEQAKELSPNGIKDVLFRLGRVGEFLSRFLTQLVEAEDNASLLTKTEALQKKQVEAHMLVHQRLGPLSAVQDLADFRSKLPQTLKAVNADYNCIASGLFTTFRPGDYSEYLLQAYATQWKNDFLKFPLPRPQGRTRSRMTTISNDILLKEVSGMPAGLTLTKSLGEIHGTPIFSFLNGILPKPIDFRWHISITSGTTNVEGPKRLSELVSFFVIPPDALDQSDTKEHALQYFAERFTESLSQFYRNAELYTERKAFLTDVTHQLITPLANAIGICSSIMDKAPRLTADAITARLREARGLTRHCAMSTSSFHMAASKSDSSDLVTAKELNETSVKLTKLVIDVAKDFQTSAETKKLSIHVDTDFLDVLGTQEIDEQWVRHALMNVLDNAVKYTRSGSGYTIRLFAERKDSLFAICVSNPSSIPIRDEYKERIFERWFRTPEAEAEEIQGTGIGLSLAKDVTTAHGGHLEVGQAPEVDGAWETTFRLWLPISRTAES